MVKPVNGVVRKQVTIPDGDVSIVLIPMPLLLFIATIFCCEDDNPLGGYITFTEPIDVPLKLQVKESLFTIWFVSGSTIIRFGGVE